MSLTSEDSGVHHHGGDLGLAVVLAGVIGRPRLWVTALVVAGGLARARWWRTPPFLPLPDPHWLQFRLETAYGSSETRMNVEDIIGYLEWCKMMRKIA